MMQNLEALPQGHRLTKLIDNQLETILRYYKTNFEKATDRILLQLYILKTDNTYTYKTLKALVVKTNLDFQKHFPTRELVRVASKDNLIDIDNLEPIDFIKASEEINKKKI